MQSSATVAVAAIHRQLIFMPAALPSPHMRC